MSDKTEIHGDDMPAIQVAHNAFTANLNNAVADLQDKAYALGFERGKASFSDEVGQLKGIIGLDLLLFLMTKIETYEDCPPDQKLLVWTGDSFDTEYVSHCADTGTFYPANGVTFTHYVELPCEQTFMSDIEKVN